MLTLRADVLAALPGITHGFFGRTGGVSGGIYASLNCGPGSGDAPQNVAENRRRVQQALGARALNTLHQIHSPDVVTVTEGWTRGPQADGMVTATTGIALGILTADCAPVLFADAEARVAGAAHAGWKGALAGVLDATVAAMERLGARRARIAAAIGPCISQANYEVGPEFHTRFAAEDARNARFFLPSDRAGHHRFDLEGYVSERLNAAGVDKIARLSACTYARDADFFSFRRTTHRGEKDYGREISAILLT
ncbi:MAG TPA: peptidoglycan editing factor PgeF [Rhizomicrobium sp.]|nr:peptidoglycan editing factor PgeF [Rhizomicrobium sp.]